VRGWCKPGVENDESIAYNAWTMRKGRILSILGFVISGLLLFFSLRGVQGREIWLILKKADTMLLFVPLVFIFCAVTICSFRWSRIAGNGTRVRDTFVSLLVGLFVNNVLPLRIGELARGYVLSKKRNVSFTYAFSTVLLDRFFDLTGLLLITFLFFPSQSLPPHVSQAIRLLVGLLIVCVGLMIVLSQERIASHISSKLVQFEASFLKKFAKRVLEIQENLKRIGSPLMILFLIALSFCTWLSMAVALYFVTRTLGVNVPFACIPFVCAMLNMGLTIPSSPGYVGVYQYLLVYLLAIFGVPKTEGFTVSLLYHASWYLPYTLLGFVFLVTEHIKVKEIQNLKTE
jgi:glycosyltransferase 2 family protein